MRRDRVRRDLIATELFGGVRAAIRANGSAERGRAGSAASDMLGAGDLQQSFGGNAFDVGRPKTGIDQGFSISSDSYAQPPSRHPANIAESRIDRWAPGRARARPQRHQK
jgi:hypothetical protein